MNAFKLTLLLAIFTFLSLKANAQEYSAKGGLCGECDYVQRYNAPVGPRYRHNEDVRRYNAAPNPCAYRSVRKEAFPALRRNTVICAKNLEGNHEPVKLRTELVSQNSHEVPTYDASGYRYLRHMTVTIYKDIYSDGRSRIWQHVGYSS